MEKNKKKYILFITAFPPCGKTAGQDYSKRVIEDLVVNGYVVSLIYFEYPGHIPELPESVKIIEKIKSNYLNCIKNITNHPFFTKRYDQKFCNYINGIAGNFDLIYFDFSQVFLYGYHVKHPSKILMSHDVIYQKYSRRNIPFNTFWIRKTESKLLNANDSTIITFSDKDSKLIKELYGVDSKQVNFYLKIDCSYSYDDIEIIPDRFCFYGAWNRKENEESLLWFIDKIYNKIKRPFTYVVIGGGMSDKLRLKLESLNNFTILGFVDDPIKEIAKSQALIALLFKGAGVKVKVVDALSTGTPVVGTNIALEGIKDNFSNPTLLKANDEKAVLDTLNSWITTDKDKKETAAKEFFERYNRNHIISIIDTLI